MNYWSVTDRNLDLIFGKKLLPAGYYVFFFSKERSINGRFNSSFAIYLEKSDQAIYNFKETNNVFLWTFIDPQVDLDSELLSTGNFK